MADKRPVDDVSVSGLENIRRRAERLGHRVWNLPMESPSRQPERVATTTTGGPSRIQREVHEIYKQDDDIWTYDDEAKTISQNHSVIFEDIETLEDAQEKMLEWVREEANNDEYPEYEGEDPLDGTSVAQMLDLEEGEDFDGAIVRGDISAGESVSSSGASTCVIVIMVTMLADREIAVCRHFTAGTDHFEYAERHVTEMRAALVGEANVADGNIDVYAVGGLEGPELGSPEEYLALGEALVPFNLCVFRVPAQHEDDEDSVEAIYDGNGFRWAFEGGA